MTQRLREKALQTLLNEFLVEIQRSNQKIVECCLQQTEITVEFLQVLRRHIQRSAISYEELSLLVNNKNNLEVDMQERCKNVSLTMKKLFESNALRLTEIGKIVDLSRPATSLIVNGNRFPDDETTLKGEMFFQAFSVEELRQLFLPIPSENQQ